MLAGIRAVSRVVVVMKLSAGSSGQCRLSTSRGALSRYTFRKLLLQEESKKSRRKWHLHDELLKLGSVTTAGGGGVPSVKKMPKNSPRLQVLNKSYLNHISDILSTGEVASQLYGRGLELSEVRLHPDLQGVNVYWIASGDPQKDAETEELLNRYAKVVRHQLSSLRIIGHSPPIIFVRDHRHHKLLEVEKLLAEVDYGDDFEPTDPAHHLRASIITSTTTPLPQRLKASIEDFNRQVAREEEDQEEETLDPFEEALRIAATWPEQKVEAVTTATTTTTTTAATTTGAAADTTTPVTVTLPSDLPTMRGDVLGVNTTKIYKMIQQNMTRARAEHRRQVGADAEQAELDIPFSPSSNPLSHPNTSSSSSSSRDIKHWASRYKKMQREEARKQNKEVAMLSVPLTRQGHVEEEEEEVEVLWVEEEEEEEEEFR